MYWLFIRLTVLVLILGFLPSVTLAGDSAHGTDADVLVGLAIKDILTPKQQSEFNALKQTLMDQIQTGKMRARLYSFVEQVDPDTFLPSVDGDAYDVRALYKKMVSQGLLEDIQKTPLVIKDKCVDLSGALRPATSSPAKFSPICLDIERIAALYLVPVLGHLNGNQSLLFGIMMHEFARHYGEDDAHEFLLAMAKEGSRQFLVDNRACKQDSNLCDAGTLSATAQDTTTISNLDVPNILALDKDISPIVNFRAVSNTQGSQKCLKDVEVFIEIEKRRNGETKMRSLGRFSPASDLTTATFQLNVNELPVESGIEFTKTRWTDFPGGYSSYIEAIKEFSNSAVERRTFYVSAPKCMKPLEVLVYDSLGREVAKLTTYFQLNLLSWQHPSHFSSYRISE